MTGMSTTCLCRKTARTTTLSKNEERHHPQVRRRLLELVADGSQRQYPPEPPPRSRRAAVSAVPTVGATERGLTAASSRKAHAQSRCGSKRHRHRPRCPHELPGWMGSTRGAVPTPSASPTSHFFYFGEKCEKNPSPACSRELEEDAEKPPPSTRESTICSTIRSELRSEETCNAVEHCLGRKP